MPTMRELATTDWQLDKAKDGITTAAVCVTAQALLRIEALLAKQNALIDAQTGTLNAILSNLLSLGTDGLHQVIRHHRRVIKRANAKARRPRQPRAASTT